MTNPIPNLDILGLGFDMLGTYSTVSCKQRVMQFQPSNGTTFTYVGETYAVPTGISVQRGSGASMASGQAIVFESGREIQQHFSAKARVAATYGGFSGQAEALYGSSSDLQQSHWYALLEGSQEVFSMSVDQLQPSAAFLADADVKAMLRQSTFDPAKPDDFFRVFRKFGTHVVKRISVGASIYYCATVERSAAIDKMTVGAKLSLEFKAVTADSAGVQAEADWSSLGRTWANSRQVKINSIGGTSKLLASLDPSYGETIASSYTDWLDSIDQFPGVIDFRLEPLSTLFSGDFADTLGKAIKAYTDCGIYVDASISAQDYAGMIQVSGKLQPRRPAPKISGGAQLVVVDARSGKVLYEQTVYGCDSSATNLWSKLLGGTKSLGTTDYFCALSVFAWYSNYFPNPQVATWLESCGASLKAWRELESKSILLTYAFVGRSGWLPGKGLESIDWNRGQGTAFASVVTPLIPQAGGGFELGATPQ